MYPHRAPLAATLARRFLMLIYQDLFVCYASLFRLILGYIDVLGKVDLKELWAVPGTEASWWQFEAAWSDGHVVGYLMLLPPLLSVCLCPFCLCLCRAYLVIVRRFATTRKN